MDKDKKDPEAGNPAGEDNQDKGNPGKTPESGDGGKTFTQADVDRIVTERLDREKKKAQEAAAKAAEDAEKKRLEEAKEWESLAKKAEAKVTALEAKVTELEAAKTQLADYEGAITKVLTGQREGMPAHLTALLDKLSPLDQLNYLAEHAKDLAQPKTKVPGTPPPANPQDLTDAQTKELAAASDNFYRNLFT